MANADESSIVIYEIKPHAHYNGSFPSFREPTEIGFSSLNSQRLFQNDDSQMKFLAMPSAISGLDMDLSKGYKDAIRKSQPMGEKLDNLLKWILSNKEKVSKNFGKPNLSETQSFGADFVCYRGLLTELIALVYENRDDILFCATRFRGTIYLCQFPTELRIQSEINKTSRQDQMCFWGYKFEQYMTSDEKHGNPNLNIPVNELEEFDVAFKGRLGSNTLLYQAEVDCVDTAHEHEATKRYVELKTSRIITTERQDQNFCRFKLLKWWAQSFLIGIQKIICGFRDDHGFVRNIRFFRTKQIPKMAEGLWSPNVGMNFCNLFLNFIKTFVIKDDPHIVYRFYRPVNGNFHCEELLRPGEFQILPDWYISASQ